MRRSSSRSRSNNSPSSSRRRAVAKLRITQTRSQIGQSAKQRGATSRDALPIGPFRTSTVPVNIRDLDRFDDGAEVTPESLVEQKVIKNTRTDVKILGNGEISKKLRVRVHAISATAREKIEGAGGSVELLRPPKRKRPVAPKRGPAARASQESPSKRTEAPEEQG